MYDPTVVDTFLAVYRDLLSEDLEPPSHHRALAEISRSSAHRADDAVQANDQNALEATEEMLAVCALSRVGALGTFTDAAFLIGTHVRRIIPDATCVFYAFDPATDHLVARHVAGTPAVGLQGRRIPAGHCLTGWVAVNRQAMVNSDAALDLGEARVTDPVFKSCLSTPLLAAETLVGVLTLYSTSPAAFSEDQARVIQLLTPYIAATLQTALELESRSARDAATRPPAAPLSEPALLTTGSAGRKGITRH
ncbi:MAG: hypothetical protein AUH43_14970 [Acidobacteria bacterium 13_1_40CM_65_14]|nr:MAG: hypothetical protein AUH43_14970 [Acidobacteria bacterium 13_1_40CM_65_14]